MFQSLASAGVNIQMISTSEVKVSCAIDAEDCDRAIAALCETFDLSSSPVQINAAAIPLSPSDELPPPVRGVALDKNLARLGIRYIPDRPGMAAKLFGLLAKNNISVDTIIQSQRCRILGEVATRDIAFTVARPDAEDAPKCWNL
jgi:aspartate kinase